MSSQGERERCHACGLRPDRLSPSDLCRGSCLPAGEGWAQAAGRGCGTSALLDMVKDLTGLLLSHWFFGSGLEYG